MQNIIAKQKDKVNHFKVLFDQALQQHQEKDAARYLHSYLLESKMLDLLEDIDLNTVILYGQTAPKMGVAYNSDHYKII